MRALMLVRLPTLRLKRFCQKATCKVQQHKHILAGDKTKKKQKPKEERRRRKETTCALVD